MKIILLSLSLAAFAAAAPEVLLLPPATEPAPLTAVPEPALALLGAFGLLTILRRRRTN